MKRKKKICGKRLIKKSGEFSPTVKEMVGQGLAIIKKNAKGRIYVELTDEGQQAARELEEELEKK